MLSKSLRFNNVTGSELLLEVLFSLLKLCSLCYETDFEFSRVLCGTGEEHGAVPYRLHLASRSLL